MLNSQRAQCNKWRFAGEPVDFLARHSIVQRSAQLHAKFVSAIQHHHHRQRDHVARLPGKAGAAPDFSPGVAREQVLKRFVELIAIFQRCIDVRIPSTAPRSFIPCSWRWRSSISRPHQEFRNAAISLLNRSCSSILERCAALSSAYRAPGM